MMLLPFLCWIWNLVTVYHQTRCTFLIGKVLTITGKHFVIPASVILFPFLIGKVLTRSTLELQLSMCGFPFLIGKVLTLLSETIKILPLGFLFPFLIGKVLTWQLSIWHSIRQLILFPFLIGKVLTCLCYKACLFGHLVSIPYR